MKVSTSNTSPCTKLSCLSPACAGSRGLVMSLGCARRAQVLGPNRRSGGELERAGAGLKKLDELVVDAAAQEAYFAVGDQMGLTPLGMMEDAESEA